MDDNRARYKDSFFIVHGNVVSELMLQLSQLKGDKCVSLLGVMQ